MVTLFSIEPQFPEGFLYAPDFITQAEEQELCDEISNITFQTFTFKGYEAKRKVASFGQDWSFEQQTVIKGKDIPAVFHPLIQKVATYLSISPTAFAELLVTEYPVGSVINWHRDAPPFDVIAGISLLSDCTFRLKPYDKARRSRSTIITLPVKRRSLYVMKGTSRTDYQHSIPAVTHIRYSITLRTLREKWQNGD